MSVMPMRLHLRAMKNQILDVYVDDVYKEENKYRILFPGTGRGSR
jgi:hypothetical protein